jgi:hypothetical protein
VASRTRGRKALALLVLIGTITTAALAAPGRTDAAVTGVWSGKTHQEIPPLAEGADFVDWSRRITVRAVKGRLTALAVSVRYACPDPTNPGAGDIEVNLGWKIGRGPKLGLHGGFSLSVTETLNPYTGRMVRTEMPVSIAGTLGPGGASGRFDLGKGNCSGKGSWQAKRRF